MIALKPAIPTNLIIYDISPRNDEIVLRHLRLSIKKLMNAKKSDWMRFETINETINETIKALSLLT